MLRSIACYLSGRHDYSMSREPGALFLRCAKCGHRSPGWSMDSHLPTPKTSRPRPSARMSASAPRPVLTMIAERHGARVLPFVRTTN